jgi:hypothetical protein
VYVKLLPAPLPMLSGQLLCKKILWFIDGFEITQNHSHFFFSKPRLSEQSNTGSNSGLEFSNNEEQKAP